MCFKRKNFARNTKKNVRIELNNPYVGVVFLYNKTVYSLFAYCNNIAFLCIYYLAVNSEGAGLIHHLTNFIVFVPVKWVLVRKITFFNLAE